MADQEHDIESFDVYQENGGKYAVRFPCGLCSGQSDEVAGTEKPTDRSRIPEGVELLNVAQIAHLLGWGKSVVRQRDKKGLLPKPVRIGGSLQWSRKELRDWMDAGCPPRSKWEMCKQGKGK